MRRLRNPHVAPIGGWWFIDPDTRYAHRKHYSSLEELLFHVEQYRRANKLPPISREEVEDWLCRRPGMANRCKEMTGVLVRRTAGQYFRGAKAAVQIQIEGKDAFVSQEVAEKRAGICVKCPYNVRNRDDSRLRRYTDDYMDSVVGERRTSFDLDLFTCSVCSCVLRPKVHIAQHIISDALSPEERYLFPAGLPNKHGTPIYCWQIHPVTEEKDANS